MRRFRCIIENCNCYAYFGYEGQKIPHYCIAHKEHDMKMLNIDQEKEQKKLDYNNVSLSLFEIDDNNPKKYKKNEKKCCINKGCLKIARYNYIQYSQPVFCIVHRRVNMINLLPCTRKKSNWAMLNNVIRKLLITDENCSMIKSALLQNDLKT